VDELTVVQHSTRLVTRGLTREGLGRVVFIVDIIIVMVLARSIQPWWRGISGVNQTGRRAAPYSMPNPTIHQRQPTDSE
jgi:hypothetical protein